MTLYVSGGIEGKSSGADEFDQMPLVNGDPIVESGSNSDGEWTRFADGTQLAKALKSLDTSSAVFQKFPIALPFVGDTAAGLSGCVTNADTYKALANSAVIIEAGEWCVTFREAVGSTNQDFVLSAFGRWK